MKLFSVAYKDIFLMSLSLGLCPFGRQQQGTATTGKQSKAFTFLQTSQDSKVQSMSLLRFPFEELPHFWGMDAGNDGFRRDHTYPEGVALLQ